jgi:drug/metabolite transporter (DMT)-like permease
MTPPTELWAYGALTIAAVVWGGSIVAQKLALEPFSPVEVSVLRGIGALAILVLLWWWQEGGRLKLTARDVGSLFLLGLAVLGNHLLTLFGLRYISAAAAGIIIGASPAITAVLSSLVLRDIPFGVVWFGCAISFLGVALVSGVDRILPVFMDRFISPVLDTPGLVEDVGVGEHPWLGALLVLLGLVSWALYTIGGRRAMERFSPLTVNWTTLFCSIIFQIPLLALDQKIVVSGPTMVPLSGWLALLYLVVFATALGQQAWLFGVKGLGPSRAGIFVNVIPVSALVLSAVVLDEPIGLKEGLGITLILFGVWLVNRRSRLWTMRQARAASL